MMEFTLTKDGLRKEFSKDYKSFYQTEVFKEEGFERRKCSICGKNFWSISERDACDDPSHTKYGFFRKSKRKETYDAFWKKFEGFFVKKGHASVGRYPVVSRWRQDLYFTIASIQDFQRIENGNMSFEYQENPLIVPQICLRFNDIENVGVTGRHLTSFMMAGQHAFDYPKKGYWRDETIRLNYDFLTGVLGVKKEDLVYIEDAWAMGDMSEFGPCLESFSNGLELVNSVFTQFESSNGRVKELRGKVVDVGWGFERLLWFYSGFNTAYEAVFNGILARLDKKVGFEIDEEQFRRYAEASSELDMTERTSKANAELDIAEKAGISQEDYIKKLKPAQALYAVLDHTRTLLFAIADGALPSNIGGGYNLRVILRRSLGFIEEYKLGVELEKIAEMEASELKMFPELKESLSLFSEVISAERKRYASSRSNASKIIESVISKKKIPSAVEMRTLYESNGIPPELLASEAAKRGMKIEVPEGIYEGIMKGDFVEGAKKKEIHIEKDLPKTKQLYYSFATESKSKVLYHSGGIVVLDSTPFYPEGGGQEADKGSINGFKVLDVQKADGVIAHFVEKGARIKEGESVECKVDIDRRERLMAHHTATHLMSAAARHVLGKHAWQEGARKGAEKAHIDVAHYEKLDADQVRKMEDFVNSALFRGIKVRITEMKRGEAEGKYGFSIYQGHGVPSSVMRMVIIEDKDGGLIDAEACGGMHVASVESMIGMVKITNAYKIHDGVNRIEFVAGNAALDYFRKEDGEIKKASELLNADIGGVGKRIEELMERTNKSNKEQAGYMERIAVLVAEAIETDMLESRSKEFVFERDEDREIIRKALTRIISKRPDLIVAVKNKSGDIVCVGGEKAERGALEFVKDKFGKFKGGGSERHAEGVVY